MFTRRAISKTDYANLGTNIQVDYKRFNLETTAVIAAINQSGGVIHWRDYGKSVDIPKFISFLKELRKIKKKEVFSVFMDNLAVHRANITRDAMEQLNINRIFNAPYSP